MVAVRPNEQARYRGVVNPRPGEIYDRNHQLAQRAFVRRCLYEIAARILSDLEAGRPLGEITWTADTRLSAARLEVLLAALGDEQQ